jgi:EAL domain-containing protein (putative c-di-GMP-specific phosphodiesterase class I)
MSRQEWNDYIRQCIEQGQLALLAQNVVSSQAAGELLHREVFLQLQDKTGQGIPAGRFMATSNELGLSTEVDKQVITCLAERLAKGQETARFAINLSSQSVEDEAFMAWLKQLLQSVPAKTVASRLVFELNEADVIRQLDKTRAFASEIRALGCGLGIDQFGKTFADFAFLNSLRPDYVKIDRIYSHELREDADAGFFISSLCGICRSLDIAVIAQAIETAEQGDMLRQAGVAGLQGYAIEKPGILDSDPGK